MKIVKFLFLVMVMSLNIEAKADFPIVNVIVYSNYATHPVLQNLSESDQRRVFMLAAFWTVYGEGEDVGFTNEAIAEFLDVTVTSWEKTNRLMLVRMLITNSNQPTPLYKKFVKL